MTDHSQMKLGKLPRRHDHRTLRLANYLAPALPSPPAQVDYTRGITDWGMMLNDQLGDCIIADGPGHATQVWTLNATGAMVTPPDSVILETYEKWCGYNPADPATDQGGIELNVLNDWRQQGFAGHALDAYVAIDFGSRDSGHGPTPAEGLRPAGGTRGGDSQPLCPNPIAQAIWLFGGAYVGVELPLNAQSQDVWDVAPGMDSEPGSWGGHAVYLVGYDFPQPLAPSPQSPTRQSRYGDGAPPTLSCITWGHLKKMTWAWFEKYCSEAYALVSKDWIKASGLAPSGFDLAALEDDLKAVSGQLSAFGLDNPSPGLRPPSPQGRGLRVRGI